MILLAGGTGRLGTLLVGRLVSRGVSVRVLTREPARAAHLAGDLVTVARGDVRDPDSLAPAAAGVDVVVSAVHGFAAPPPSSPAAVDRDGNANLLEAARAAGADFVLVSTVGAAAESPLELFRMKYAAEQHARASAVATTIVRATAFLELWVELMRQTSSRSGRALVFGRGQNPINFVSAIDVAALVDHAIAEPATRGQILEIGGPANLTFDQLAQAVHTTAGYAGAPRHVPPLALWLMANSIGRAKAQLGRRARAALAMDRMDLSLDLAQLRRDLPELPSTALAEVLGCARVDPAAGLRPRPWPRSTARPRQKGAG